MSDPHFHFGPEIINHTGNGPLGAETWRAENGDRITRLNDGTTERGPGFGQGE